MEKVLVLFSDALFLAAPMYEENKQLWTKWNKYYDEVQENHDKLVTSANISPSFSALVSWLGQKQEQGISLLHIYANLDKYKVELRNVLDKIIEQEFEGMSETVETPILSNTKDKKVKDQETDITDDYYPVSNDAVYYQLRDGIAKNQFEEDELGAVPVLPLETKSTSGVAQLSSHKDEDLRLVNTNEAERWSILVDGVISNMDDLTADCLDTITIQWLNQAKSPDEFIDFSYENVLDMCNMPKARANGIEYYRAEDKIKIAQRIAALASIFIYLNDDNEVVVLNDRAETGKQFEMKREVIKRLFVLDSVVLWRDKNTNDYVGIESCRIKPGSFLSMYLYGSNSTTALLSKKALEYNSYRHKFHKRLIRYLSWQWRIRQQYSNLQRPYSIGGEKGLLSVMGINIAKGRPHRIREQLENVLIDLEKEKVISHWAYSEELDESRIGERNWFKNYYSKLGITILPPKELMDNIGSLVKKKVIEAPDKQENNLTIDTVKHSIDGSEDMIRDKIMHQHMRKNRTMREIADEIGLSPATLSRFCNKKMKRISNSVNNKLTKWYERQIIIESM
ncbi:XRE family transcriptional regulator [Bacillus sp. Xin]|uniref:helix-turn-helix domain-containing protein n=1 Tax=unclassified Bacillus (in: firmicutes) TaxID=185979 RepID=UPI0015742A01|nr:MULTISPECIES: XRE family transcriptional regulator [unclassified Bacillus (in: firmicutes)]MBC6974918.1 XRE family transcriptional regulator [Bacillus sp. Xin]NSW39540.1 XRE family transcriptional regulator [Bacillus sp. Xin1]